MINFVTLGWIFKTEIYSSRGIGKSPNKNKLINKEQVDNFNKRKKLFQKFRKIYWNSMWYLIPYISKFWKISSTETWVDRNVVLLTNTKKIWIEYVKQWWCLKGRTTKQLYGQKKDTDGQTKSWWLYYW